MIVVEPEAPQAIHAACVSLPNPCDVKQLGAWPGPVWSSLPRAGSGGLYGPPFPPSTPFFALSAVGCVTTVPASDFSAKEPADRQPARKFERFEEPHI